MGVEKKTSAAGETVARAAVVIMVVTLVSRLLGFVRDAAIAAAFGATGATDAYLVAYTLPNSLQAVLGVAFVTVIVPVVTAYLVRGQREEGWHVASAVLNWTGLVLAVMTAVGMGLAPWMVRLIAPGFTPEEVLFTTHLTRIMFPSIIFMGTGMFISGILNAGRFFTVPAMATGVANVVIILAVLALGPHFYMEGVAWGTLAGFVGFLLVQLPNLKAMGFRYFFTFDRKHPAVRRVALLIGPVFLAVSVNQVYLAMNRFFASGLERGLITALDLGNRALNLPGIFVYAVYTATFPALAEQVVRRDREGLTRTLNQGLGMMLLAIIPASVGMMVLREPVVSLLYQRGAFDQQATWATATALLYFLVGFPAQAANQVLNRTFYAMEDAGTPVKVGLVSVLLNAGLSLALLPGMGHGGLALSNSLATIANTVLLLLALRKPLPGVSLPRLFVSVLRVGVASLVMGAITFLGAGWLEGILDTGRLGQLLVFLAITVALGAVVFIVASLALRVEEVRSLRRLIRRAR